MPTLQPGSGTSATNDNLIRKIFIVFLVSIAVLAGFAISTKHLVTKKMEHLLQLIENENPNRYDVNNILLLLNQSENSFQKAVYANDAAALNNFRTELQKAFNDIDSLVNFKENIDFIKNDKDEKNIRSLFAKKEQLSDAFFQLKKNFDSLLIMTEESAGRRNMSALLNSFSLSSRTKGKPVSDTTEVTGPVVTKKRGFFKRLKDVFSNKADTIRGKDALIVNTKHTDSALNASLRRIRDEENNSLNALRQQHRQLSQIQSGLLLTNQGIMSRVKTFVDQLHQLSAEISEKIKAAARKEYRTASDFLSLVTILSLIFVFFFALMLVYYARKINLAKEALYRENKVANSLLNQKTDMLAVVSHEIRNPLNTILGFVGALKDTQLSEQQTEMIQTVEASSNMLSATVNDILDMSKIDNGSFQFFKEQFNPYNTLRQTVETMRFSASSKKISLDYHFKGDKNLNIIGDTIRLRQIVINLVSNAVKFTDKGGVTVTASLVKKAKDLILTVTVQDTGRGIPKSQQAHLFTKYYQAQSSKGTIGTGLGLYICHKLVKLQNGTISFNSVQGEGSGFTFSIPYVPIDPESIVTAAKDSQVNISVFAGKKIVVVDDSEFNLKVMQIMMAQWDASLIMMKQSTEVIQLLRKEPVDIVITDMHMPEMDGKELITAIRKSKDGISHIPVVLLTGESYTEPEKKKLEKLGFSGIITKPFTQAQLSQVLFKALSATS